MIAWIKIASRNLVKNRRRSILTIIAIALGYAAVGIFGGFTSYMYNGNRQVAIFGRCQGHLTVFKKGFLEKGELDPSRYLLRPREISMISAICRKNPHVIMVSPQLRISGLVTNGRISTIFIAQGIRPSDVDRFLKHSTLKKLSEFEGHKLSDDKVYGVAMAHGLARLLDLRVGDWAVVLATTVDGQMNALDLQILQLFNTDSQVLNDKIMRVPLRFAQSLYDTQGVDRIAILLDRTRFTEKVRDQLTSEFARENLDVEVRSWDELSLWYRKVKDMFDVIFLFLFIIVFIIVVMSVVNTMGMSVLERTREIGTLRALGLKRRGVLLLFGIESILLGICGAVLGIILTFTGWLVIHLTKPTWIPPGITTRIPLRLEFSFLQLAYTFIFLVALCLIASLVPARRAARQSVVDALGHV